MRINLLMKAAAAIAALALAFPIYAAKPDAGGAQLRFQVFESTGDMMYRVMEAKFCEEYGLKCRSVRIGSGPAGIQALLGNSLEVSFITTDAAIRAIEGGADVRIVHGIADRVPFYLVARSSLDRPNADKGFPALMVDFKGKRIGVTARGAGTELIGRLLLRESGMTANDVTFVAVGGPPTALGSLRSNQIDAAIEVPPLAEICDRNEACETVLNLPADDGIDAINKLDGTGVVGLMSNDFIDKNPKVVRAFLAAVKDASEWMKNPENFDEYVAIAQNNIRLRIPDADAILRAALERQLKISEVRVRPAAIQAYVDTLKELGLIDSKPSVDKILFKGAPQF